MALFTVKRRGHQTMLVIEAAALAAADGWLVFQCADGRPLVTLPATEVLGLETVAARHATGAAGARDLAPS